jgi:hypothetical protein
MKLNLENPFDLIPISASVLGMVWTAAVAPFTSYGNTWAQYPVFALFAVSVVVHVWLIAKRPSFHQVLYGVVHLPMQVVVFFACLMLISKDSL